jgi:flagellin
MALAINTNIAALNAQRNLGKTQGMLTKSLQRLSSGLRINSAKDDAAGFAIANRMNAQTRGLNQAVRNVNDGISLAQTAEGALQETTNILLRMRDLAIQSANDTNTATDRASLQSELNQLQQELTRIADSTTFNGTKILDGSLSGAQFQVGAEANQTMSISISDARATALGSYTIETNNASGLEASTHAGYFQANGAEIGVAQGAATNGYSGEDLIVRDADGNQVGSNIVIAANEEMDATVLELNAISGVRAVGYNQVTLDTYVAPGADDGNFSINTTDLGLSIAAATSAADAFAAMATAINANTTLQGDGISAVVSGNSLVLTSTTGADISVTATGTTNGVNVTGLTGAAQTIAQGGTATGTAGGRFDVYLDQGYTIESDETDFVLSSGAINTAVTTTAVGYENADDGNAVATQVLNIIGPNGTQTVNVGENNSAYTIAASINSFETDTGVSAEALTTATIAMGSTSDTGTITFGLKGINSLASSISATISDTTSLSELVTAINNATGETGISAELSDSGASVTLTQTSGYDIEITDFTHSAAVELPDYANPDRVAIEKSMTVTGSQGNAMTLYDGGAKTDADSTVVGGEVTFSAISVFNVSSSVAETDAGDSIFSGVADSTNAAALSSANNVDIGTREGAGSAINVIDGALSKVDVIRGDLGAVQNRFESTISNLENVAENLSAARSRIMDADFAVETAALTKAQILQQAGVAMLAQANQLPQTVLSLLQ